MTKIKLVLSVFTFLFFTISNLFAQESIINTLTGEEIKLTVAQKKNFEKNEDQFYLLNIDNKFITFEGYDYNPATKVIIYHDWYTKTYYFVLLFYFIILCYLINILYWWWLDSSALNESDDDDNDCQDQENVNESAERIGRNQT